MNRAAGAPGTESACQSVPRCSQHPATGASPEPADPQDSTDPSGCFSTAHSVGEPDGRVGAGCQCRPSPEVHRAGPRRAPLSAAPTARYPPGTAAIRCTVWVPGPSSPSPFTRCHCAPSADRNSATSPSLSALRSTPAARNPPPPRATTAVSSTRPSTLRSGDAVHDPPSVEVHAAAPLVVPPTATTRPPPTATSSTPPVPAPGTATDRHPPPWRSQARGCRVTDCPTATRSPDGSAATARMASLPAGPAQRGGGATTWGAEVIAAPRLTAYVGCASTATRAPSSERNSWDTNGIRLDPPTSSTPCNASGRAPARFTICPKSWTVLRICGRISDSRWVRLMVTCPASPGSSTGIVASTSADSASFASTTPS